MPQLWYHWQEQALILNIRVQPRASRDELAGPHGDQLKIRLTAAPVDGKANQRLVKLLAGICRVPRDRIELVSGATSRNKRVRVIRPVQLPDGVDPPEV